MSSKPLCINIKENYEMPKRFIYFYFMKDDPAKTGQHVPDHINYWKSTELKDYLGGPFADRSGGAITFKAKDIEEALVDLLANKWIKEWIPE
jgi:hypothetical protein